MNSSRYPLNLAMKPGHWKRNDFSTLIGILIAFSMVALAIFFGGNAKGFLDIHAVMIVFCGTFAVSAACFSFSEVLQTYRLIARTVIKRSHDLSQTARRALELAELAHKKGILELENHPQLFRHNRFLRDGIMMLVDGHKFESIEQALRYEMHVLQDSYVRASAVLRKSAEVAPAMGLIGTLIGLVQMMATLDDPSRIGPAMSVALLTTFYGAFTAYIIFTPLASMVDRLSQNELTISQLYFQAVLSVSRREVPRQLEVLLNSLLPPHERVHYFTEKDSQGEEV